MKKTFVILAILSLALISCNEKYKPKDIYEERFVNEYVKTDFGNPKDFIEITQSQYDTINADDAIKMLDLYRELFFLFPDEERKQLDDMQKLARDTKGVVNITFKVRMRFKGEFMVNTFFGTYNLDNGECIFGDNKDDYHQLPKVYYDLLEFSEDFLSGEFLNLTYKRAVLSDFYLKVV